MSSIIICSRIWGEMPSSTLRRPDRSSTCRNWSPLAGGGMTLTMRSSRRSVASSTRAFRRVRKSTKPRSRSATSSAGKGKIDNGASAPKL
jgi:hypothetical protein